ncbi:EAL domain-containing protein [Alkalilimnicola sp. S0819]|uniref:EAL domain-containing protein n=1 Tax=Alkalilimnicola sp. S0819 TaxID=2613922 RepID=UPI001261667A|nr:EAL domain-containing protein [Alkalilimnicola sp. S0819]KAB7628180.1 EAL domain-containing protein [Alkalilimnicola sp. S0819]MPQ15067.1 EAL domain-containing protein [Alkalilimnicola sp. S0819]
MSNTARKRRDAALTFGAGVLLGLGLSVLMAWHLGATVLLQPLPALPAMGFPAALGLTLLGMNLLACAQHRQRWCLKLALVVLALGVTLLSVYLLAGESPSPALKPWLLRPNVSVCLILAGLGIALQHGVRRRHPASSWLMALCAILIVGIAGAAAVTELAGLGAGPPFTHWTRMAPHATAAFFLVGALLLMMAAEKPGPAPRHADRPAAWRPWAAGLGVALLAAVLAIAMEATERQQGQRVLEAEIHLLSIEIQSALRNQFQLLNALARRMALNGGQTDMSWRADARQLTANRRYRRIVWLSPRLEPLAWVPLEPTPSPLPASDPARLDAARQARDSGKISHSRIIPVGDNHPGFHVYIPVRQDGELLGLLGATVDLSHSLSEALVHQTRRGYAVSLRTDEQTLYRSSPHLSPPRQQELIVHHALPGLGWQLRIWPLPETLPLLRTALPETLFALGLLLAVLLGLAIRARDQQMISSLQVRALNTELEDRVRQRTRALSREIVKRKRIAERMAHMAKHDRLTKLPNRALFQEHLEHALQRVRREHHQLAVLFLDLDHFKEINDRHGHHVGDELLKAFATCVQAQLREVDILARQSGDEFIVLADELHGTADAEGIARKIVGALTQPLSAGTHRFSVACSIGIATYPDGGTDGPALIRNADAAMYQAKAAGRGRYAVYSASLHEHTEERLRIKAALLAGLQTGLRRREFQIHYQPRVRLEDGALVGAEALLRWHHPEQGLIGPEHFLAVAEEDGLICTLGAEVLRLLEQDLGHWSRRALKLPRVSVNGAPRQLQGPELVQQFTHLLHKLPRYRGLLELELDERVFAEDRPAWRETLWALHRLGVRIVIDGFGSGSAHFSCFRNLPIAAIKIDRSLIARITEDRNEARIAETVLDLARNFSLGTVAEGVETAGQREALLRAGCVQAQGWLFGHPVSAEEFLGLWRAQAA